VLYLDTSALLKLYIRESGSEEVQHAIIGQNLPIPIWDLQEMEFRNALRLKVFWGDYREEEVEDQLATFARRMQQGLYYRPSLRLLEIRPRVEELSRRTSTLGNRTLDILHVAAAQILRAGGFMTFDSRQQQLALDAGLSVYGHFD